MNFLNLQLFSAAGLPAIGAMILGLAFLILIHEMGHWLVARLFGFQTPVFSIGFGKREWSLVLGKWMNTEFRISPILLGGYVSIPELQDETTLTEMKADEEVMRNYRRFAPWKRIAVAAAGVVFNFILAFVMLASLFAFIGRPTVDYQSTGINALSNEVTIARDAGFQAGDRFVSIDGVKIKSPEDLSHGLKAGSPAVIVVDRSGKDVAINVTPDAAGHIGVVLDVKATQGYQRLSPVDAITEGGKITVTATTGMVKGFAVMLHLVDPPSNLPAGASDVHGLVGIVQIGAGAFSQGAFSFVWFLAMLSLNLAVLNILPIPLLDGGHIVFFAWEWVTGKPVNQEIKARLSNVFFMLLVALMLYGLFNDIVHPVSLP